MTIDTRHLAKPVYREEFKEDHSPRTAAYTSVCEDEEAAKLPLKEKFEKMSITEIMELIPHRYPFLLIDRVIKLELNKSITGTKNVTVNEPQFTGHFPTRPIMPGVLMVEAMAQLAAVLVAKSLGSTKNKEVFLMAIENAKFRKIVQPGDTMYIEANIDQQRANVWKFSSIVTVDGEVAVESKFTAMIKDKT